MNFDLSADKTRVRQLSAKTPRLALSRAVNEPADCDKIFDPEMFDSTDEVVRRAEKRVGATLKGKWTIDALLGVGGMACVYVATHRNNKRVAIKILHPELSMHSDIRARFVREGYVANTVGHPGAVSVLDDDVAEDGGAFIVMELLEGETVLARAERHGGRLAVEDVLSMADQLLDVLVAAHAKGIIHRDIKPENLFFDQNQNGLIKVLDFGIARLRESADQSGTRTGALMGTPSYMPPEQARGLWDQVDGRTDVWAVGATMFTLLTGRAVHHTSTVNEALVAAITEHAPPISSVIPDLPPVVAEVVDRSLAYDKVDRYSDAAAMQLAVRAARAELESGVSATGPTERPPPKPPSDKPPGVATSPQFKLPAGNLTTAQGITSAPATAAGGRRPALPVALGIGALAIVAVTVVMFALRSSPSVASAPAPAPAVSAEPPSPAALPSAAPEVQHTSAVQPAPAVVVVQPAANAGAKREQRRPEIMHTPPPRPAPSAKAASVPVAAAPPTPAPVAPSPKPVPPAETVDGLGGRL